MDIERRRVLVALQYIRGVAALLVVADHALATLVSKVGQKQDLNWAWHLGDLGVAVFFVISGAVMIIGHHADFGQSGHVRIFMLKRILRIAPLYWITTAIYVAKLQWQGHLLTPWDVTLSLLLVPHGGGDREFGRPIYELGWTLQYELFFYVLFGAALMWSIRAGMIFISCIFLSGVLLGAAFGSGESGFWYLFRPIVLYFVAGVWVGYLSRYGKFGGLKTFRLGPYQAMALGSMILLFDLSIWWWLEGGIFSQDALTPLFAVTAVAICAMTPGSQPDGALARAGVWLGNITYALYLTHSFVLGPSGKLMAEHWPDVPGSMFVAMMLVATLPLAHMTYIWIEKPIMARSKAYLLALHAKQAGVVRPGEAA